MPLDRGLDWLLDDLTNRVQFIRHALVLSNDGLVTGASTG
ncbi:roadblock/LC7 domain-containing protein, partial [Streptomyces sp. SID7982]|nr:roadblock/LC7 domain-containing protein [Streptomyces sp. SID7982]